MKYAGPNLLCRELGSACIEAFEDVVYAALIIRRLILPNDGGMNDGVIEQKSTVCFEGLIRLSNELRLDLDQRKFPACAFENSLVEEL